MGDDAKLVHRLKAQICHFAAGLCMGFPVAASRAISEVLHGLCKGAGSCDYENSSELTIDIYPRLMI